MKAETGVLPIIETLMSVRFDQPLVVRLSLLGIERVRICGGIYVLFCFESAWAISLI